MHGTKDRRAPVAHSNLFVEAIRQNGGKVEYLRFPEEGHYFKKTQNRLIAFERTAAFLEEKLGVRQKIRAAVSMII
jgi:dipeptidyl aminopeptidase/acylaminoacyl peptidase